jgi:hypothetical protein
MIDHGAAFYRQHGERPLAASADAPFPLIADHVLLPRAESIEAADLRLAERAAAAIHTAIELVPDEWLGEPSPPARRADFAEYLRFRLRPPRRFVAEAEQARSAQRGGL